MMAFESGTGRNRELLRVPDEAIQGPKQEHPAPPPEAGPLPPKDAESADQRPSEFISVAGSTQLAPDSEIPPADYIN